MGIIENIRNLVKPDFPEFKSNVLVLCKKDSTGKIYYPDSISMNDGHEYIKVYHHDELYWDSGTEVVKVKEEGYSLRIIPFTEYTVRNTHHPIYLYDDYNEEYYVSIDTLRNNADDASYYLRHEDMVGNGTVHFTDTLTLPDIEDKVTVEYTKVAVCAVTVSLEFRGVRYTDVEKFINTLSDVYSVTDEDGLSDIVSRYLLKPIKTKVSDILYGESLDTGVPKIILVHDYAYLGEYSVFYHESIVMNSNKQAYHFSKETSQIVKRINTYFSKALYIPYYNVFTAVETPSDVTVMVPLESVALDLASVLNYSIDDASNVVSMYGYNTIARLIINNSLGIQDILRDKGIELSYINDHYVLSYRIKRTNSYYRITTNIGKGNPYYIKDNFVINGNELVHLTVEDLSEYSLNHVFYHPLINALALVNTDSETGTCSTYHPIYMFSEDSISAPCIPCPIKLTTGEFIPNGYTLSIDNAYIFIDEAFNDRDELVDVVNALHESVEAGNVLIDKQYNVVYVKNQ